MPNGFRITRKLDAAYFQQMRHAETLAMIHHKKMMDAGFTWDGMDGYEAPAGFTKADGDKLWKDAIDEAKTVVSKQL